MLRHAASDEIGFGPGWNKLGPISRVARIAFHMVVGIVAGSNGGGLRRASRGKYPLSTAAASCRAVACLQGLNPRLGTHWQHRRVERQGSRPCSRSKGEKPVPAQTDVLSIHSSSGRRA